MRELMSQAVHELLNLIYPPVCLLCGKRPCDEAMCEPCQSDVTPILPPFCDRCGAPIHAEELVCAACFKKEPPYEWSQAMGAYTGTLRRAIHRLKYEDRVALAKPLGVMLARSLDKPTPLFETGGKTPAFDSVVPVPLHPSRLRERGFNQAERIARVLAQEKGWRLDAQGLQRVRRTTTQTKKNAEERAANVRDAFAARTPLHFDGQAVLLIDDVCTTSATLWHCAAAVKNAGAKRVCVLALARGY